MLFLILARSNRQVWIARTIAGDKSPGKPAEGCACCVTQPLRSTRCERSMPLHRRSTVGVKGLDRLQPPRLTFLALFLGPDDRLPVRRQNQPCAGVGDLDPVAAGFINVEEKSLLDGV